MDAKQPIKEILKKAIYVDFYNAMINDDYKLSNLTIDDYSEAVVEFKRLMNIKSNGVEKQLESLMVSISLLGNCLIIFPTLGADEENTEILRSQGVEIDSDLETLISNIQLKFNSLVTRYSLISGELPDMSKIVKPSGEDMVAELSLALEMMLPMDINLLSYISYHKAAKRKSESIKKISNVNRR